MPLIPPRLSIPAINYGGGKTPPPTISIFTGHSHPFSPLLSLSVRIAAARCIVHNPLPSQTTVSNDCSPLFLPPPPSPRSGGKACFFFSRGKKRFRIYSPYIYYWSGNLHAFHIYIYIYIIRNIICLQNCEAIKIIEPKKRKENVLERDNLNKR